MFQQCVVDNRVFLLGLDGLYRDAMKQHERMELLLCARRVARRLGVGPADVPVEGYYAEEKELTEYFRLLRALQEVEASRIPEVTGMSEFQRLRAVTSAPLYGLPQDQGKLLAVGRDALSQALFNTRPDWSGERLTALAAELAREMDDISLVGLAARVRDPVVLAAVRESCVAYLEVMVFGIAPQREYVWQVDDELADVASRFIDAFHTLFREELPPPVPTQAERYWRAHQRNEIVGRCVRIGYDDRVSPVRHYYWGICRSANGDLAVQEFWSSHVWTTALYRRSLDPSGRAPRFGKETRANEFN